MKAKHAATVTVLLLLGSAAHGLDPRDPFEMAQLRSVARSAAAKHADRQAQAIRQGTWTVAGAVLLSGGMIALALYFGLRHRK